jgi:hypothetical protein
MHSYNPSQLFLSHLPCIHLCNCFDIVWDGPEIPSRQIAMHICIRVLILKCAAGYLKGEECSMARKSIVYTVENLSLAA